MDERGAGRGAGGSAADAGCQGSAGAGQRCRTPGRCGAGAGRGAGGEVSPPRSEGNSAAGSPPLAHLRGRWDTPLSRLLHNGGALKCQRGPAPSLPLLGAGPPGRGAPSAGLREMDVVPGKGRGVRGGV